ncbi:MAG: bifunctional YncE family protein/alkaline phosphatase family protein [Candidatus Acidiferrales bacterium]
MGSRRGLGIFVVAVCAALAIYFGMHYAARPRRQPRVNAPQTPSLESRQVLPSGMTITPMAAPGAFFVPLNPDLPGLPSFVAGQPVTTAVSPDGATLLVLTSGYNRMDNALGREIKKDSNEYVFVFDISQPQPRKLQVLQVPNTFDGIAWNPNGAQFYVSGGVDDDVHTFARRNGRWAESGSPIALKHGKGLGIDTKPEAAGVAVTADGKRLLVANFENDSVSMIDLAARKKIAELDLRPGKINSQQAGVPGGEFPFWIVIKGNDTAYVSSPRDRQIVVLDISGEPKVKARIAVPGEPTKMILDREQNYLYAALPSDDGVAMIDTASNRMLVTVGTTAPRATFSNPGRLMGSNPNGLALSPDGKQLYVTNGGANSIAVIDDIPSARPVQTAVIGEKGYISVGKVSGLIPTGWYPSSVSASRDGKTLYVVTSKSIPGPNVAGCRNTTSIARGSLDECYGQNEYILQLNKGGFEVIPTPQENELASLTKQVAANDHYVSDAQHAADNRKMAFLRAHIKHVIYIIKENRTYDQVLGDLPEGNGDPHLAMLPQPISPNHHQLAQQFVDLDNFYCSGDVSGEGWNWSTAARASQMVENIYPINYAGRGMTYDFEGDNRNINVGFATLADRRAANPETPNDKDLLPGTADLDAPDGPGGDAGTGYLWDAALRANLTVRNYGFFLDGERYFARPGKGAPIPLLRDPYASKTQVAFADKPALMKITDPYFRGFDLKFPDYWRYTEWHREFQGYIASGKLPNLELVRLGRDHFGDFAGAIDGTGTVEAEMGDNDYSIGKLIEQVAKSPFAKSTVIFIVEDDAQNGPDHVDAHRSVALIAGAYVKQGAVISTHYTTVNMLRTIEEILGMKPMGINDDVLDPMADVFTTKAHAWSYTAIVPQILRSTKLPLPPATVAANTGATTAASPEELSAAFAKPRHDAAYWAARTRGFDFSVEDHINSAQFNRILWKGLMGPKVPYPKVRDGRDLRRNRGALLRKVEEESARESKITAESSQDDAKRASR